MANFCTFLEPLNLNEFWTVADVQGRVNKLKNSYTGLMGSFFLEIDHTVSSKKQRSFTQNGENM
jgi:hypothetical protein